jgi:hypothetical protein
VAHGLVLDYNDALTSVALTMIALDDNRILQDCTSHHLLARQSELAS